MFPNLKAELSRRGIFLSDLAVLLGVTVSTVSMKLNGKTPLTLAEAKKIKNHLGVALPLEELFEEAE